MEEFGQSIQDRQDTAGGLMRSALGKARGLALRLSLVLELLWWCGQEGMAPAPAQISARAFIAAAHLLDDYFLPMADRVYGDAAASPRDRDAATLARWIIRQREQEERPSEVSVRHLQRDVRLPGLTTAEIIHERRRHLGRGRLARKPATRHRTSRTVRLSDQPACLGGRAMSRWAERFTALSRSHDKSDNSDKRSSDDPGGPSVANCQNCHDQKLGGSDRAETRRNPRPCGGCRTFCHYCRFCQRDGWRRGHAAPSGRAIVADSSDNC